ncbi:hypothetical protein GGI04_003413 [Coemansia thaxteri]|nr:hypothetical protein GGI04_003413 [Coemansia thaxteri]
MALDRHSAGSDHPASTNKTTIQTTLDAINCILLECGILKNLGADAQRSDKRVEETEATASSAAGDTLDHSTGLNLDNLSIANETALDTRDGMPDIEQQSPFQLSQEEEWEREQVMSHRNRRYILAAKDLEGRLWDDSKEERLLAHGYYRNRERWWHNRQVARTKELELDEIDRQEQTLCREQRASKVPSPDASATETTATITEHSCSATKVHTQRLSPIYRPNTNNGSQSPTKALVQESQPSVDSLFAQPVQWDYVDATLLQAEVEPVVKMLLLEYLGGDADDGSVADLVEFVIGHLRDHKSPQSLVEELEMVLVDEAPAFVAQIWRVLLSTAEPNALPQS